jgi:uncharacterized protein YbjT (DUF2867 family)
MKMVAIGGTGLIGSKTVTILRRGRHKVVAASRKGGVNTVSGEGLKEAMDGAQRVIDVSKCAFIRRQGGVVILGDSGRNFLTAEAAAGVRHRVALSTAGPTEYPDNPITAPRAPTRN